MLSRYARSLSAGWSSMQSEQNARNPAVSPDAGGLTRNMLRHNDIHLGIASAARTLRLKAGLNVDRGRDGPRGADAADDAISCVPGVSGCRSATQPCATDRPSVSAGRPKMLSRAG